METNFRQTDLAIQTGPMEALVVYARRLGILVSTGVCVLLVVWAAAFVHLAKMDASAILVFLTAAFAVFGAVILMIRSLREELRVSSNVTLRPRYEVEGELLSPMAVYVLFALFTDFMALPLSRHRLGAQSNEYYYIVGVVSLIQSVFGILVVASFVNRIWGFTNPRIRRLAKAMVILVLPVVFMLSILAPIHSLQRVNLTPLGIVVELSQNLYFAALVLNTGLYVLFEHLRPDDEKLLLQICGLGVRLSGISATFALAHLTVQQNTKLIDCFQIICTCAMFLIWFYTVSVSFEKRPGKLRLPLTFGSVSAAGSN